MTISIAERRTLGNQAAADPAFRALLKTRPHEAIREAIGRQVDQACKVDVIDEGDEWRFVLVDAAEIERNLPNPIDARSAIENDVYALLRDNPPLREEIKRDPTAFARDRLGLDLEKQSVTLHTEEAGSLVVLVPNRDDRETIDDELMDLVAGGGNTGINAPPPTSASRTDPK